MRSNIDLLNAGRPWNTGRLKVGLQAELPVKRLESLQVEMGAEVPPDSSSSPSELPAADF